MSLFKRVQYISNATFNDTLAAQETIKHARSTHTPMVQRQVVERATGQRWGIRNGKAEELKSE